MRFNFSHIDLQSWFFEYFFIKKKVLYALEKYEVLRIKQSIVNSKDSSFL